METSVCVFLFVLMTSAVSVSRGTPLDDYVNAPDANYRYTYLNSFKGPNYAVYLLNMTSQKWLTEEITTTPVWWHYVAVIVPTQVVYRDTGFFWIGGGSWTNRPPDADDKFIKTFTSLAVSTGTVCGVIYQIPFQPTVFQKDPAATQRYEDAIIAWTWRQFLDNGSNPEILLRLPMTKAVVRGMDTLSSFAKTITGSTVNKFVIGGESKRGWTTWTTAAVDKRVVGMVPTVMDLLNIQKNMHHHFRSLGGWTFEFWDYYNLSITYDLDSPNIPLMQEVIDPLTYASRYTMPKMIVTTSGDEFFLPDDSYYYFDQLPEPKFLRVVPNAEHSMKGHYMANELAIQSFFLTILENATYPSMSWVKTNTALGGSITVTMSREPKNVTVYYAHTLDDKRRDFRLFVKSPTSMDPVPHPVVWLSKSANRISPTQFEASVDKPLFGWAGFFIQVQFAGVKGSTLEFTTEVNIVPDTFPFPDCSGASCYGTLV
ncbi:autocrine proliferation repressor protein A-like [Physella acuta]|uniref:autocrine proliferation repressor protein A-like n=1 Tax=Physella acuta TaxID=109671 RepID=UPI0027DBF231|nr:autocrine proliferation repressor protein A-like [Physella acuta]